jgi:hypothetical protein
MTLCDGNPENSQKAMVTAGLICAPYVLKLMKSIRVIINYKKKNNDPQKKGFFFCIFIF